MAKLTLSVDPRVVQQAKRYARARRTSVSRLVEPPVLHKLRGLLRRSSTADYRRQVIRKYR